MKKSKLLATLLLCASVTMPSIALDEHEILPGDTYVTPENITTITNAGTLTNEHQINSATNNSHGVIYNNNLILEATNNQGNIYNAESGNINTLTNLDYAENRGNITIEAINSGTLDNVSGEIAGLANKAAGTVNNSASITSATNQSLGEIINNHADATIGTVENKGILKNLLGKITTLNNKSTGEVENSSAITNANNEQNGQYTNKSTGSIENVDNSGKFTNEGSITSLKNQATGEITNNHADAAIGTVENKGVLKNLLGKITGHVDNLAGAELTSNASDIKNTIANSGVYNVTGGNIQHNITEYKNGKTGTLNIGDGMTTTTVSNSANITQTNINVHSDATFDNVGTITVGNLDNKGIITDSKNKGRLNIRGGSNSSQITQKTIDIKQNSTFDNTGKITAKILNNHGKITDSTNSGSLIVSGGKNDANCEIIQNSFEITGGGEYTTEGEMTLKTLTNNGNLIIKDGGKVTYQQD